MFDDMDKVIKWGVVGALALITIIAIANMDRRPPDDETKPDDPQVVDEKDVQ